MKPIFRKSLCAMHYSRLIRHGDLTTVKPPGVAATSEPCKDPGCERVVIARGYCGKHYQQWIKHGRTYVSSMEIADTDRFWEKVEKSDGCWRWVGTLTAQRYGVFRLGDRQRSAHRLAYEWIKGPIPEGLELDHLCHTNDKSCPGGVLCFHRACVNPDHLEPVPGSINNYRSQSPHGRNYRKTHCVHGHEFTPENTRIRRNASGEARICRECERARCRANYHRNKPR